MKLTSAGVCAKTSTVTPHAGVWIEILAGEYGDRTMRVTPHAGVWIEIRRPCGSGERKRRHPPRGGVD